MVAPYNYMQFMPQINIGAQFAELGEALAMRRQRQAEAAAREQEAGLREQYAQDLQAAFVNPTQATWGQMIAKYPGQREAFAEASRLYGEERISNEFRQGAEISNALESGEIGLAKRQLETIIAGYENSNQNPGLYRQIYDQLVAGNVREAQAATNMSLSLLDPDKFRKVVEGRAAFEAAAEEAAMRPLKRRELTADVVLKEAKAKFAPENLALDIDLTKAQIAQAKAAIRAQEAAARLSGAEAERKSAEAAQMGAGIIPPEKRPDLEGKLRKEYFDNTKSYQIMKDAYGKILTVSEPATEADEGPADLALIFSYMKILDPGSTVREGEFANAQNAAGVSDRVRNLWNNLRTGGRLNPGQRKAFRAQAEKLYRQAQRQESQVREGLRRIARGYGLNEENIFYGAEEIEPTALPDDALLNQLLEAAPTRGPASGRPGAVP